jgi:protein involved in polysaccharide export with SLBB domain
MSHRSRLVLAIALVSLLARGASAQSPADGTGTAAGLAATRPGLEARAARLEQAALAPNQTGASRAAAAREAAEIRQRLADGDFRVGDRIVLAVEGEPALSDTFTVALGTVLPLPTIGDVSLAGVLRSELKSYVTRRLGESLRDPVVRARAYVRLSIQGAVAKPGYYGVPADALLSDAIMTAGGPTGEANVKKLRIERAGRPIWEGSQLQEAIAQGRTVDDAGLIAGDQFVLPHRSRMGVGQVLLLTVPPAVYALTQILR